ncbi:MAG TPA: methionyl-tRNA formyltransferase [Chlamydiales bacterium]|nr:methionyl-tRNA formyltransferase [Chlamydiales bacterium]
MKIVFFGTPYFAAEILGYLFEQGVSIAAIVTQPDRPKGRALQLAPSPVKSVALEKAPHIPILQPEKASNEAFLAELTALKADLFVVVAYGQILSQKLLDIPPLGSINVHPSLLPKFRGAAPIHRTLMEGETETGVAIQKIVRQLDAGDVIAVAKFEIPIDMTFGELEAKLCEIAKPLLLSVLQKGIPLGTPQDHNSATYASKIELEEGEIDWTLDSKYLHNLIRAFSPRPGAWCWVQSGPEKKRLKVLRAQWLPSLKGKPGEILSPSDAVVACGEGALKLLQVQPEGKKAMGGADWLRGQKSIIFN